MFGLASFIIAAIFNSNLCLTIYFIISLRSCAVQRCLCLMGGRAEDFHFQVLAGLTVLVYIVGAVSYLGQEVLFDAGGAWTI